MTTQRETYDAAFDALVGSDPVRPTLRTQQDEAFRALAPYATLDDAYADYQISIEQPSCVVCDAYGCGGAYGHGCDRFERNDRYRDEVERDEARAIYGPPTSSGWRGDLALVERAADAGLNVTDEGIRALSADIDRAVADQIEFEVERERSDQEHYKGMSSPRW